MHHIPRSAVSQLLGPPEIMDEEMLAQMTAIVVVNNASEGDRGAPSSRTMPNASTANQASKPGKEVSVRIVDGWR